MTPDIKQRIKNSKTNLFKAVFPELTNHHNTMHGGKAMELMDDIAFLTATRFVRKGFITVGSTVNYNNPLPADTIIEVTGEVEEIGETSLKVSIKVYVEEMYSESRKEAIDAMFTLVCVDDHMKPIPVLD